MSLDHGGHLTHGAKVNVSGKLFRAAQYGIRPDSGEIDYEQVQRLAEQHRPKMIVAGFSAYSRVIDWARFAAIARSVDAYFVVDMAHVAGLVAAGLYPNPLPHADVVTTTTHKTLRGPRGGLILARANEEITRKLNSLVFPGTPACTTRGFTVREVQQVADFIAQVLDAEGSAAVIEQVRPRVIELCGRFPVYGP